MTQSYHVAIALTTPSGGVNTIDPVERLSVFPSDRQPLLVELGVLQGGHDVLFLVQPGTVVRGSGTCTPGPITCQIVALAPNQIEGLYKSTSAGAVAVAQMAVTEIKADNFSSAAAADTARGQESAAGRRLLDRSTLSALSLFEYKPSLGALADLRNLTVGGTS
jgi:hypothetical protein